MLRFTLNWQGREVEVSFVPAWLNTGYDHIELREFIHEWLDAAADSVDWRTYVEESRQLKLF